MVVENECVMTVVTQLYLGKPPENNYMFRPLIEWAIIRLKQENKGEKSHKITCNIHHVWGRGKTKSRF
jgi:hypothetical protein